MGINTLSIIKIIKLILTDFILLLVIYFIPSLTHLTGIPLHNMSPMRFF